MAWPTKTDFVDGDVLTAAQVNNIGTNLNEIDPTGITDGYVVTADGAGGLGWEALPPSGGMTAIATGALAGVSTITWSSLSQDYKLLRLFLEYPSTGSNTQLYIRINGATTAAYRNKVLFYGSAANYIFDDSGFAIRYNNSTASAYGIVDFPSYTSTTKPKTMFSQLCGVAGSVSEIASCVYTPVNTNITSITLYSIGAVNFNNGNYTLYGVS